MRPLERLSMLDARGCGGRLRSRATLVHAAALLVLMALCTFDVPGTLSLVIVVGLAVLLRREHLKEQRDLALPPPHRTTAAAEDEPTTSSQDPSTLPRAPGGQS